MIQADKFLGLLSSLGIAVFVGITENSLGLGLVVFSSFMSMWILMSQE